MNYLQYLDRKFQAQAQQVRRITEAAEDLLVLANLASDEIDRLAEIVNQIGSYQN